MASPNRGANSQEEPSSPGRDNNSKQSDLAHEPVLYKETLAALDLRQTGRYIDGTVGAGGHAWGILEQTAPSGTLLGLDLDPVALDLAAARLAPFSARLILIQSSYQFLVDRMEKVGWKTVDGILLDLGLSSMQLDTPERGFSFQSDSMLDMRFDPNNPVSARDLVNTLSEDELAGLLWRYGEEQNARRIARMILRSRPLDTTRQLADAVLRASPQRRSKPHSGHRIHPATRTFQALRIAVNRELEALETVLPQAVSALGPGGRLVVISYHSLEDRLVKQYMRKESMDCICPPGIPQCTCGHAAQLVLIGRKPIVPQPDEVQRNSRSRSAKLRVAKKI